MRRHKHVSPSQTAAVWASVRAFAEETRAKKTKILWLTRTIMQVQHVAAETGAMPVYGRRVLCLHETVKLVDERRFSATCRAVRLSGRCPYWPGRPRALRAVTVSELRDVGRMTMTCPYEHQTASLSSHLALVATHRQLNSLGWLLARWRARREEVVLVLDEVQHILSRVLSMVKDAVSLTTLSRAAREAEKYGFPELSSKLRKAVEEYKKLAEPSAEEIEVEDLLPGITELLEAGQEIQETKIKQNLVPTSWVLTVADFKASLGGSRPILVREGESLRLEALADPAEELRKLLEGWRAVVMLSATLDASLIERLVGAEVTLLRAGWPFDEDALTARVVRGLTTKYEHRTDETIADVRTLISSIPEGVRALVFLPSHEFVQEVLKGVSRTDLLVEARGMRQEDLEKMLEGWKEGGVVVAPFGGRLAEGVDLPADLVLLVGVPFAPPSPRVSKLLQKLMSVFNEEDEAWLHGFVLPALFVAVQAAGRAVRGPEDRALVLLIDDRYRRLLPLLPR